MSSAPTGGAAATGPHTPATGNQSTGDARPRLHFTTRGVGMASLGLAIAILGVGFATDVLVYIGMTMVCAVAVSVVWVWIASRTFVRSRPHLHRSVAPYPLTAGKPGRLIEVMRVAGARRITNLNVRVQVAPELTHGPDPRASIERGHAALTMRCDLHPRTRGRWEVGPVLVRSASPFGLTFVDTPVGTTESITVWPPVVDLSGTVELLMGHAENIARGARAPSADDVSLREYRDGDDLRRVHWPSSARRGTMVVRSDEHAGRRRATIIVDPPSAPEAVEHVIILAASVAASVLTCDHPARLVGAGLDPATARYLGERDTDAARHELLNHTVDLRAAESRAAASADLVRCAQLAAEESRWAEVTVAIVEPLAQAALLALAPLGETGRAWAIVRADSRHDEHAEQTVTELRRAGWRAVTASVHEEVEQVWARLLATGDAP